MSLLDLRKIALLTLRSCAYCLCHIYPLRQIGIPVESRFRCEEKDEQEVKAQKYGSEPFTPCPTLIYKYWLVKITQLGRQSVIDARSMIYPPHSGPRLLPKASEIMYQAIFEPLSCRK